MSSDDEYNVERDDFESDEILSLPPTDECEPIQPHTRLFYAIPFICILNNLPSHKQNGMDILTYPLQQWLIPLLTGLGLSCVQGIYPSLNTAGAFMGRALIVFGGGDERECFRQARKLERAFYDNEQSRLWFNNDLTRSGPYCWVADETDRAAVAYLTLAHVPYEFRSVPTEWENDPVDWDGDEAGELYRHIRGVIQQYFPGY